MGYKIVYGPENKEKDAPKVTLLRLQTLSAAFLLFFVLCVRTSWPAGTEKLQEILLPGKPSQAGTAFETLVENLQHGDDLTDAVTVFCQDILEQDNEKE